MQHSEQLSRTPLYQAHVDAGARMVGFSGYEMPVQYSGIVTEHNHCRAHAGLFDVSHMGQAELVGPDYETVARALEAIAPTDALGLAPGRQKYTQLLTDDGGIIDDLMFARPPAGSGQDGRILLVVNAARTDVDFPYIAAHLPESVELRIKPDLALIALQGPDAEAVMVQHAPALADMAFMDVVVTEIAGVPITVSRSGYTGEDGYEISLPSEQAAAIWQLLVDDERVQPIGLGARDTLRLEAGLCLYGSDITTTTNPVEAGLLWSVPKRRREEGGFSGAATVSREAQHGALKKRIGMLVEGRVPVRGGAVLFVDQEGGKAVGYVTSGGKVPTIETPIAMGYVLSSLAVLQTNLFAEVRGKRIPVVLTKLPFTPARFKR